MRLKKAVIICGVAVVFIIILILFSAKDLSVYSSRRSSIVEDFRDNKWLHFEERLKRLEQGLSHNHDAVDEMKIVMKNMLQASSSSERPPIIHVPSNASNFEILFEQSCPINLNLLPTTNIQMLQLYKKINFDNQDGGVWKQGWRIEIDKFDWNSKHKLKVFVVPHSHNDPGWIKTVDQYYITQTKHILNNMITKLPEDPRRKFIWAEISYFAMWWNDIEERDRDIVKKLIRNNQLEIVTGGWVMNDEANAHWIAILQQLTEGHQWLQENLNYTPISSWSIDPFGMSLTQPFLLKEMGFRNMLIHRIHYSVKKELASKQQLEFLWRQLWDGTGKTDMFTHMMPFYSYDIPHTCGPDPKICCQFDFKRLPNHGLHCPWKVPPQEITEKNVAQRAELLLDQYRKKSKLYKTNVVLAPLGDDFRYDHPTEWDVQYENYQKLFDYMNSNPHLNVQAQFGTLSDYFTAVHKEKVDTEFPTLTGDFFTYADRDDHYWSGYYTSRPFYKRMDRILLSYLRAAEIIQTLAYLSTKDGAQWINDKNHQQSISDARRYLSLFQHHDGITGTAKDHVVNDYGKKMLNAINICQHIIQEAANILLSGPGAGTHNQEINYYNVDDIRHGHNSLGEHHQITIGMPEMRRKKIVVYNSLTFSRSEVVTFYISTPFVEVFDFHGKLVHCQVSPIFEYGVALSQTKYQLSFVANISALSLISYTVNAVWKDEVPKETQFASIKIFNHYGEVNTPPGFETIDVSPSASEFTIQNAKVKATFNHLGLLKALKSEETTVPVHLDFAKYGVRNNFNSERSGAYLFLPDGDSVPLAISNTVVNVLEGSVLSMVVVQLPYIHHTVNLYNSIGADGLGIEIQNIVDISKTSNFEIVMRLSTNINSSDEFFTDVNGYQIMRRKRFKKLPLQANFYPCPSMIYIEDKETRLSLITSSPLGCSSLKEGQIEIMLDRRLNQDDNLGLGQGVLDNIPTKHVFRILLERRSQKCSATAENHPAGFPTLSSFVSSQALLNPIIKLIRTDDDDISSQNGYTFMEPFPVDYSLPTFRTGVRIKGKEYVGIILHRQFIDLCFVNGDLLQQFPLSHGSVNISNLRSMKPNIEIQETSLSFSFIKNKRHIFHDDIRLCPMEIQAYVF